jgi:hypothetical protein
VGLKQDTEAWYSAHKKKKSDKLSKGELTYTNREKKAASIFHPHRNPCARKYHTVRAIKYKAKKNIHQTNFLTILILTKVSMK